MAGDKDIKRIEHRAKRLQYLLYTLQKAIVDAQGSDSTPPKAVDAGPCDDEFNLMQAAMWIRDDAAILLQAAQDTYDDANTFYQAAYETWLNCESP